MWFRLPDQPWRFGADSVLFVLEKKTHTKKTYSRFHEKSMNLLVAKVSAFNGIVRVVFLLALCHQEALVVHPDLSQDFRREPSSPAITFKYSHDKARRWRVNSLYTIYLPLRLNPGG